MRNILCHGLWLSLFFCSCLSLRAAEPPTLTEADKKLFESLFQEFLFDPRGAERVAIPKTTATRWVGFRNSPLQGWRVRGQAGKPDVVHFSDGSTETLQPGHEVTPVDFVAECRGRYITEPPGPADEKQRQEFRRRGEEVSRGLWGEHDAAIAAWLYRLGEPELAALALKRDQQSPHYPADYRKQLRDHGAYSLYAKMQICFINRADQLALDYGELLEKRYPPEKPEKAAEPSEDTGPDLLEELRRRKKLARFGKGVPELKPEGYEQWPVEKKVAYQIDSFDECDAMQFSSPGSVSFNDDPRVVELVRLGDAAVQALIDTLEHDERLTRSVHYHRTYNTTGHLLGVREPALEALEQILRTGHLTYRGFNTTDNLTNAKPEVLKAFVAHAREHWKKYGHLTFEQRMLLFLRESDSAGKLRAAENLANLGTKTELSRYVSRGSTTAKREEPVVESLFKLENPTVAEAIFAALEQVSTIQGVSTPEGRMSQRQSAEASFLPCLVRLGDRRIAPRIRERLREPTTALGRLELCIALHYLGDSEPFNEWCDEFRLGKLQFASPEEPRFVWPKTNDHYQNSQYFGNTPPGLMMVRDLSRAKLPAADAALYALAEKNHPQHKLAAEYFLVIEAHWSPADPQHPFGLKFLCDGLEDRTPTDTSAEVRGNTIKYITNPKNDWGEELLDYLADPAQRQESVVQRRCDIYGRRLSSLMFGGPRFHPLLKDPDARLAELKLYHDRHAGRFRRLEWYELQALRLSPLSSAFIPNYAVLTKPATPADVAAGRAMFTLGENAAVSGLKLPAVAVLAKDQAMMNPPRVLLVQAEVDAAGKTSYGVIGIDGHQILHDGEVVNIESIEAP